MRWRKAVLSGGAALGAAAAYNALVGRDVGPLDNLIGGDEGWFRWRGWRVQFTRRGHGPPVLLVHSIHAAAFSYEWRHNVDALARWYTVYTIDLLGFGRSDRPGLRYTARLYIGLLADFAAQVVGQPCALVASSLSAAYAIVLGARDPGRFPALVLVEPTGLVRLHEPAGTGNGVARVVLDAPIVGTALFNSLASRRSIELFLRETYADEALVTDDVVDAYYAAAHQPGAKHAPSAFIAQQLNIDVRRALRRLSPPTLLVWGEQAVEAPVEDARGFLVLKPDLELAILDPAGGLPHDERPQEFNELTRTFLTRLDRRTHAEAGV
jgi:pimeloyl-ACP methyl ester carboxylesterase